MGHSLNGASVRTSVVVPAYEAWQTLPAMLEALRPQVDRPDRELVLVESSGRHPADELERRWPWAQVVVLPERTLPGRARNLGLERAAGELIAFTDADAVPEAGWLDELESALGPGVDAVAGAIVNGTPESRVGTAGFLLEFAEWSPRRTGPPLHGATCNLLVRRTALEKADPFPFDMWPGEDTVVTARFQQAGKLAFAPAARVRHLNRRDLISHTVHQYRLGRSFAAVCRQVSLPHAQFTRLPLAVLAGPLRIPRLFWRLATWKSLPPRYGALLPALAVGVCAWSAGLVAGNLGSTNAPSTAARRDRRPGRAPDRRPRRRRRDRACRVGSDRARP